MATAPGHFGFTNITEAYRDFFRSATTLTRMGILDVPSTTKARATRFVGIRLRLGPQHQWRQPTVMG